MIILMAYRRVSIIRRSCSKVGEQPAACLRIFADLPRPSVHGRSASMLLLQSSAQSLTIARSLRSEGIVCQARYCAHAQSLRAQKADEIVDHFTGVVFALSANRPSQIVGALIVIWFFVPPQHAPTKSILMKRITEACGSRQIDAGEIRHVARLNRLASEIRS